MIIKVLKILIVINLFVWQFQIGSNNLKLYFLDIGQGDSTLVVTPDNFTILIDGGPDNSVLSKLSEVLPFYINKLNLVILTHPDKDHVGGLADVSKNFDIEYVMYTDSTGKSYEYEMFMDNVKAIKNLNFNDDLRIGCCTYLHMLWPNNTDIKYLEPNDGSISFELIYKNFNVYFAGDLSKL
jgi:competence protein ComEC